MIMDWERELKYNHVERSSEISVHAWLLIWSWGFLIPAGTLIWTHTKRNRPGEYPRYHALASGLLGVVLALAGFGYGIKRFSTFSRPNVHSFNMAHAVIGTIATAGLILQVLLVAFMKKEHLVKISPPDTSTWLKVGHLAHRYLGFLWIFCGLVACETGTHIAAVKGPQYYDLGLYRENEKYAGGFIGALAATAVVTVLAVKLYKRATDVAVAPEPYENAKEQEQSMSGDVETPPEAAFEIGDLEDVAIEQ